ncbi:hypothetical protein L615_011900000020 [Nocardioides sp. J9]|uniref:hypothetical protein n=1 Tax=unclassified Nocardioides TaxID=2615069 RepID=UPI0004BB267E|nr:MULTISPECIES: hypothetical protein [unclassified Nocardioides]TWH03373.1 hypothetical protein L615_011900000020 [Nocardioides sp. J9]
MQQQQDGLQVAVHGHPNADTLLLWHPAGATDRDGVAALASRIATRSHVRVVVPTWTTDSAGRDLLRSVRYARESAVHPPDQLSVVGYGAAGIAALGLALNQRRLGIGLARVTCVDGAAGIADPISGQALPEPTATEAQTAVDVVEPDTATGAEWARATVEAWRAAGWAATLVPRDQFTWRVNPSQ